MSSGHGISGGVGRCYPFFAQFKECLVSFLLGINYIIFRCMMVWQLKRYMSIMVILSMYKRWSIYLMSSTHHTNYYPLTPWYSPTLSQKTEELVTQEDGTKKWKNNCWQVREDYFECLHAKREYAMVSRVSEEEKRQAAIAASGP